MGTFYCKNCDRKEEYKTLDEALDKFDHAFSLQKGVGCPNNNMLDFTWDGVIVDIIKNPQRYKTRPSDTNMPKMVERKPIDTPSDKVDEPKKKRSKA